MWKLLQSTLKSWNVFADDNRSLANNTEPETQQDVMPVTSESSGPLTPVDPNVKPGEEVIETPRKTVIINTPSFSSVNQGGNSLLTYPFGLLGTLDFKFKVRDEEYREPIMFGKFTLNTAGLLYHDVKSQCRLANGALLGLYCNTSALGMYLSVRDLIPALTISGKSGVLLNSDNMEAGLQTEYVKENLHITGMTNYSQENTSQNKFQYDAVLRHKDFLFGYSCLGTLLESETWSDDHRFSFGWTDTDYVVNFITNSRKHEFMFYQVVTPDLEQAVSIRVNTATEDILTQLGFRWRIVDDDAVTVKVNSDSMLGIVLQTRLNDYMRFSMAANVSAVSQDFDMGFGVEYEA